MEAINEILRARIQFRDERDWAQFHNAKVLALAIKSTEAQKLLKLSGCKHSHLRLAGKLPFKKKGNSFFYEANGIKLKQEKLLKDNA